MQKIDGILVRFLSAGGVQVSEIVPDGKWGVSTVEPYLGEIRVFAGDFAPEGWVFCEGATLSSEPERQLYELIQTIYGGNGSTFQLPDLRGAVPVGMGEAPGVRRFALGETDGADTVTLDVRVLPRHRHALNGTTVDATSPSPARMLPGRTKSGANAYVPATTPAPKHPLAPDTIGFAGGVPSPSAHDNSMPTLSLNFILAPEGRHPSLSDTTAEVVGGDYYLGEVRIAAFERLPENWLPCDGQQVPIKDYPALYSVLRNSFGGSLHHGVFYLPDLRGRIVSGANPFASTGIAQEKREPRPFGSAYGSETIVLDASQIPEHRHTVIAAQGQSSLQVTDPSGNYLGHCGTTRAETYAPPGAATGLVPLHVSAISPFPAPSADGKIVAHENRQPYLTLNYMICFQGGEFPRRG